MTEMDIPSPDDPRFTPALDLLRRTGVRQLQIRYSDDEDPTVWFIVAAWYADEHHMPVATKRESVGTMWKVGSAFDPVSAAFMLLNQTIGESSGGACAHCMKLTGFDPSLEPKARLDDELCWWTFDGEKFERGCA